MPCHQQQESMRQEKRLQGLRAREPVKHGSKEKKRPKKRKTFTLAPSPPSVCGFGFGFGQREVSCVARDRDRRTDMEKGYERLGGGSRVRVSFSQTCRQQTGISSSGSSMKQVQAVGRRRERQEEEEDDTDSVINWLPPGICDCSHTNSCRELLSLCLLLCLSLSSH